MTAVNDEICRLGTDAGRCRVQVRNADAAIEYSNCCADGRWEL